MSSFLPPSTPQPIITYKGAPITLPPGCDVGNFTSEGLPLTTKSRSKSKYVIPWDPGICDKSASDLFKMIKGRMANKKRGNYGYSPGQIPSVPVSLPFDRIKDSTRITWLGHATSRADGGKASINRSRVLPPLFLHFFRRSSSLHFPRLHHR